MALLKVLYCTDPLLRKKARKVKQVDENLRALLADMVETMKAAPGLGLAAPQVGAPVRAICVRECTESEIDEEEELLNEDKPAPPEKIWCLINPAVVKRSKQTEVRMEGCLSLPTLYAEVLRPAECVVVAQDLEGKELKIEASGMTARCLQHEIDHLQGVLFLDRCDPETLAWMVPDETEDRGFRFDDTTPEEVLERFERLRGQQNAAESGK